jgi:hypothetical protein
MSYRGLWQLDTEDLEDTSYLTEGSAAFQILESVANDTVTTLLSGSPNSIMVGNTEVSWVDAHPEISAVFGSHEDTARLIATVVLASMLQRERDKAPGARASGHALAESLPDEITRVLRNGDDPAACESDFNDSFARWGAAVSALSVPKTVSKTGYCDKSLSLLWGPDGHILSCQVASICRAGVNPDGSIHYFESPPPSPSDPRAPAPGSTSPKPPPTKAQIESSIKAKMKGQGESLEDVETQEAWTELSAYLSSLTVAKGYLALALGLPAKATDTAVSAALALRGISPSEALDWFYGCDFDTDCFRESMNLALGESDDRKSDRIAKTVVFAGVAVAVGLYFWKVR